MVTFAKPNEHETSIMKKLLLLTTFSALMIGVSAQGLEDIIVETYYVSDANDATDTNGGSLAEGSVTYRIFVDMTPGYELQAIYGNSNHEMFLATTTEFFNNADRGEQTGDVINDIRLDENTVALDSWLTLGAASDEHIGVPKALDTDGSIVGGANNDGGSAGIAGGLLANADAAAGIPLTTADGLILGAIPSGVVAVGLDLTMFGDANDGPVFSSNGGAWSVLEGVQGPTADNIVLIAQITTTGEFSFELNIQLGTPDGSVIQYVAKNAIDDEVEFAGLTFPAVGVEGCTSESACNFDPAATSDDGSCLEPVPNCQECDGATLVLVDQDNDGICDADDCLGDFNNDGSINTGDLLEMIGQLGCSVNCTADIDGDGVVQVSDLLTFLGLFGTPC